MPAAKPIARTTAKSVARTAAKAIAKPAAKAAARPAAKTTAVPANKNVAKPAGKTVAKPAPKPAARTVAKTAARPAAQTAARKPGQAPAARAQRVPLQRMSLDEVMTALERAGTAQARRTYTRHGAPEPLFGVSFATLKMLAQRIKLDQPLAEALWRTGNFDARNLAVKIADPAAISAAELDRWAATASAPMCDGYVAQLAAESPHGRARADRWLAARDPRTRCSGWSLVAALALLDEGQPEAWFTARLVEIERGIHAAPNAQRYFMNQALIAIGCRSAALQRAAWAAARRLGPIEIDHGDTACQTPDAAATIARSWAYAESKGFESPAAQERARESRRTRC